jgi:hypothetical protein
VVIVTSAGMDLTTTRQLLTGLIRTAFKTNKVENIQPASISFRFSIARFTMR